jgi:AcrR family transcriptional regulator
MAEKAQAGEGRRTRAKGRESRRKIIEAAAAVAGERGYEGTSIAQVSRKSGLPASSIYWHFADKDALLAAVVEESVELWLGQVTRGAGESLRERVTDLCLGVARTFRDSPDFLRLCLMLALERRPVEPAARGIYLRLRAEALDRIAAELRRVRPRLSEMDAQMLATYALAGGDGIFLASLTGEADVGELIRMHAEAMVHLVTRAEG